MVVNVSSRRGSQVVGSSSSEGRLYILDGMPSNAYLVS